MIMDKLPMRINDLPDEILLIILRELSNVEVLYSLIGANKRLEKVARDTIFVNELALSAHSPRECIRPLPDSILDRFLLEILPKIHHRIKCLSLESTSMEKILFATNFPGLRGLGLHGIGVDKALSLFTGKFIGIVNQDLHSFI